MKELCGHFINRRDFVPIFTSCLSVFSVVIIEEKLIYITGTFVEFTILLIVSKSYSLSCQLSWSKDSWWFNDPSLCSMWYMPTGRNTQCQMSCLCANYCAQARCFLIFIIVTLTTLPGQQTAKAGLVPCKNCLSQQDTVAFNYYINFT